MSVGRKTGSKPLAFVTALMVLFALAIPFMGSALANHDGDVDPTQVTLTPETDSAPTGTCNPFTVTVNQGGAGETVDVSATQQDTNTNATNDIAFCDPSDAANATDLGGDSDVDDNGGDAAFIFGECMTDTSGQCVFGVTSDEAGTMNITAWYDSNDNNASAPDTNEPFDTSTKTWTAGGASAAKNITCTPTTDSNPEGSRHEFQCTVTDTAGTVLPGVTVNFDVTAGPNSEEVPITACPTATDQNGQTPAANTDPDANNTDECGYTDAGPNVTTSPPGTDTIVAYVNQAQQAGQPAPTNGPDAGEPQQTLQKTWTGQGRTIDCEPETASNQVGTSHVVTCTVRDVAGQPVSGVDVSFSESGPGFISSTGTTPPGGGLYRTDANGQVQVTVQSNAGEATGTQTITGTIVAPAGATTECAKLAGNPTGSTAGACSDSVQKTWTPQQTQQPECNDGEDNDGDGRIDFGSDPDCGSVDDTTEAHFPVDRDVATNLTIRYDANDNVFKGSVGSSRKRCQVGRQVTLKKVTPGPNRTVGRDTSNSQGSWSINKNVNRGRFYAVVSVKRFTAANGDRIRCLRDRSVTIKV